MTITFPSFLKPKYFSMEIVILMEKEKRTLSYVRIYLSPEPPYTADWMLIKESLACQFCSNCPPSSGDHIY